MEYLVTGGTGHLGANLVRQLLQDGHTVRCLVLEGGNQSALDGLNVRRFTGDLRNAASLDEAVRGVDGIYHVAAEVSTFEGREQDIFLNNVMGTRHLLQAALAHKIPRVVVTGSLSATGFQEGKPCTEADPYNVFRWSLPYSKTKFAVEHECLKAFADGLDVVIVTSTAIIGPNDFLPSRMGRTLCEFAAGKIRAYVPGSFEFVATRDIVRGHILGMQKGRGGQKYIISSGYHSFDEILDIFSRVTGQPKPRLRLSPRVMMPIAKVVEWFSRTFAPQRAQRLTPAAIRILQQNRMADTSKARRELGFVPTPVETAVAEAYACFQRRGVLPTHLGG